MISLRNFFSASKEAIRNLKSTPVTILFPSAEVETPLGFRGSPELDSSLCTLCKKCERGCPTGAIRIEEQDGSLYKFSIDLGRCCYCKECETACNFNAIYLTENWKNSTTVRNELVKTSIVEKKSKKKKG